MTTEPITFEADNLPNVPGFREALSDWLREHGFNPAWVISVEIGTGQPGTVTALVVALKGGKPYADEAGLLATETITGISVTREPPKPEGFHAKQATR